MQRKVRILIDQDSVIYDLDTPWTLLHNRDYPDHNLPPASSWDRTVECKESGCPAEMYDYFLVPELWESGEIIAGSKEITEQWSKNEDLELSILTTLPPMGTSIAAQSKIRWLQQHFPHIEYILMTFGHIKHWINGDILIDDGVHNLEYFRGIRILYNQPWNSGETPYIRAHSWKDVDYIVSRAIELIKNGCSLSLTETVLRAEQKSGVIWKITT